MQVGVSILRREITNSRDEINSKLVSISEAPFGEIGVD